MILKVIRALFLMLVSTVALIYLSQTVGSRPEVPSTMPWIDRDQIWGVHWTYIVMVGGVVIAFAIITIDLLAKKKNLSAIAGLFLGIVVGMLVSLGLGFLINQVESVFGLNSDAQRQLMEGIKLLLGLMTCYVTISFILQTKDDFRFIIPYVEFTRATKGPRPLILDTSVIIDGRIADMARTGIFESRILVPRFVLNELQTIADSGDKLKRMRGKRGLDVLKSLREMSSIDFHIWEGTLINVDEEDGVDQKLVALGQQENGRVVTNDSNLNKIAQLRGVDVININLIADAVKPVVLPGEPMRVRIVKPGESPGQGVGYLEDGTMVVVEGARDRISQEIELIVTNMHQTAAGKMIFGRIEHSNLPKAG
jgi:uncharacterized protein YacL